MTERELRESVRKQIIQNFHENKRTLVGQTRPKNSITLSELRKLVRSELIKRLHEQKSTKPDPEVVDAAEELEDLDSVAQGLIGSELQKMQQAAEKGGKKKTEAIGTIITLAIAAPGLLGLLSKLAKLISKGLKKVTGSKNFDPEKEGETFEHAAHALHKKYISWLKPVVKVAFKKYIKGDEEKAEIYAQVLYAVILAGVSTHAAFGAGQAIAHSFHDIGNAFHAAYEAAHSTHVGLEATEMGNAMRAALAAVGEKEAATELTSAAVAAVA